MSSGNENDSNPTDEVPEEQNDAPASETGDSGDQDQVDAKIEEHKPYKPGPGAGFGSEEEENSARSQRRHFAGKTDSNIFGN